jgi:glycerol-3-phosphate dehydrogenase (NAD(P)+)
MAKISIIGAGKWGEALHYAISLNHKATITSRTKRDIENFVSLDEALNSEYLVIVISAQSTKEFLKSSFKFKNQKILVASKGIDESSLEFLNEIYEESVPKENLAFLTGPSFAKEVKESLPTALVINSSNLDLAKEFEKFFPKFIKTYSSCDVIGAEICGAYKNVIAIASGICDGLKLGNNARASLISRGLVEMNRFGKYFGASDETFLGLSGAGDLFLTASSNLSRNYRVGFSLANGKTLDDILIELGEVAEGVKTANAIYQISTKHSIYTPIANEVYLILNGKSVHKSLEDLLKS